MLEHNALIYFFYLKNMLWAIFFVIFKSILDF